MRQTQLRRRQWYLMHGSHGGGGSSGSPNGSKRQRLEGEGSSEGNNHQVLIGSGEDNVSILVPVVPMTTATVHLFGSATDIASFTNALITGPVLRHTCSSNCRFKACPYLSCVVCLSIDWQRQVQPESVYVPKSLKETVLIRLALQFVCLQDWHNKIPSLSYSNVSHEDIELLQYAASRISAWHVKHALLVGPQTATCLLTCLHWKTQMTDIEYTLTASFVVSNTSFSGDVRWPIAVAYHLPTCSESTLAELWESMSSERRLHWLQNVHLLHEFNF